MDSSTVIHKQHEFISFKLRKRISETSSIGCFVCSSFNGSNPNCEDTFNSTVVHDANSASGASNYQYPCWAFKKQRQGLFPADHCIKVNGHHGTPFFFKL